MAWGGWSYSILFSLIFAFHRLSQSSKQLECLDISFHGYLEDCAVFLFSRKLIVVNLTSLQRVATLKLGRQCASFIAVSTDILRYRMIISSRDKLKLSSHPYWMQLTRLNREPPISITPFMVFAFYWKEIRIICFTVVSLSTFTKIECYETMLIDQSRKEITSCMRIYGFLIRIILFHDQEDMNYFDKF